ncbi:hypothetical protein J8J14_23450 [Roseomonas sp. SSH11]|uniref:Uncharacterized protein n=1 Tax=Pararoseomonas baculiformis TaxID=2820812 RepID=A0ABS4AL17_9PROT|nr:hypothetical protein [Pararoseomonas baculiformis]MBP0447711.1 hypothetical protein [Pararoseomonas baculiformis]
MAADLAATTDLTAFALVFPSRGPGVTRPRPPLAQLRCEVRTKAEAPTTDTLVADHHASLGEDQLNVAQAQAEKITEPAGMVDDLGRKAVARIGCGFGEHPASLAQPSQSGQGRRT